MYALYYNQSIDRVRIKYNLKDKLLFFLYSLYFILKPFYFWSSGLPQISDFLFLLLILFYTITNDFKITFSKNCEFFLKIGLLFITWIIFVNVTWTLRLQTGESFIFSTLYYLYNFLVTSIVVALYSQYKDKIIEITYKSVLISVLIQVINYFYSYYSYGFTNSRTTLNFNNPNQLGYYSLLMASFLLFISQRIKISIKWFIIGLASSMILIFASLSKAAILSFLGLIILYILFDNNNKKFKQKFIMLLVFLSILVSIVYSTTTVIQNNSLINAVQKRVQNIGKDPDDNPESRGYYRIFEYPEYWLCGAGEGEYTRFRYHMEFHSTLGNIQVSYGLVGTLLFMFYMILALRNDKYRSWYILLMIMVYGLTHNGIRNSLLWILLALIASINKRVIEK